MDRNQADMSGLEDAALLEAIATRRDRAAFTELCERHRDRAYSFAVRILRKSELAEDAVQDAMLAIWLTEPSALPKQRGNAENWIMGIIIHKSIDLRRSLNQSAKREERVSAERNQLQSSGADSAANAELIAAVRQHLDTLPELECQLLTCCYGANMTHQHIAETFSLSRSSVTEKIQKALERLRSSLTRAGLAAAIPLAGASMEALTQAARGGHTCPPELTAKILSRLDGPGMHAARELSKRTGRLARAAKTGSWMPATAVTVALAAAGVFAWTRTPPTPSAPPAPLVAPAPLPTPAAPAPTVLNWNFDTGLGAEFVDRGHWASGELRANFPLPTFVTKSGKDGSGALKFPASGASLFLKTGIPVTQLPVKFEFELWVLDPNTMSIGIWTGRNAGGPTRDILKLQKDTVPTTWKGGVWIHVQRTVREDHGVVITRSLYDGVQRGDYLEESKAPAWTDAKSVEFYEIYGANFLIDNLRITYGN